MSGETFRALADQAWLDVTDDFTFEDGTEPIAEAVFKVGFLAALQLVAQANQRRSRRMRPALREALEILELTNPDPSR